MRTVKKVKCDMCDRIISVHNIKKHKNAHLYNKPPKYKRKYEAGIIWNKGKTYIELFGEEKAFNICKKISVKMKGKSTGRANTIEKEKERRHKIALAMKGNKNGSTSFRMKKVYYNDICFKSKWEVNVAIFLDSNNIKWKYENITYSLSETTSYTPDFSIYENEKFKKHIEVKGYFRKENKEKFDKFLNMYPTINIEVWDKNKLLEKNISTI